jgi:hypothetical protein
MKYKKEPKAIFVKLKMTDKKPLLLKRPNKNEVKMNLDNVIKEITIDKKLEIKKGKKITREQAEIVADTVAAYLSIPYVPALTLIFILLLKGAANQGTPNSIIATVTYDGKDYSITKEELLTCYQRRIGDKYIRRMAEVLATDIS